MAAIVRRSVPIARLSRNALAWGLGVFVALQLGLALAIELWWPVLRDPFFGYKAERLCGRTLGRPDRPLTVVMIGTSRTEYALQGSILEEQLERELRRPVVAFNFGVPGTGPITHLLYFKRLLARGLRPDLLLVEVLPPLLDGKPGIPLEARIVPATRFWLHELPLLQQFGFPGADMRRTWWQAWPVPWFSHRFAILSWLAPAWVPLQARSDFGRSDDQSGWTPRPRQLDSPEQSQRALALAHETYAGCWKGFSLGGPPCRALVEILSLCRREGVTAALVLMPEGPVFRSWYPAGAWGQVQQFLSELSRARAVPVINARTWLAESDFLDSHHFRTEQAAAAFTERLTRDEIVPLLKRKLPGAQACKPSW
jgi:hypothetical protein